VWPSCRISYFRDLPTDSGYHGKAVGFFANPRLELAAPRGQAGDLTWPGMLARFQPPAGSPVGNAGIDLKAVFKVDHGGFDFLKTKTPAGNAPDIGAIERRNRDVEE
jgi:hypothetical protein